VSRPVDERIRVVELVASGTNGGAQEHVASMLSHIDRNMYDVRVIGLSDGSAVRRWRALGVQVEVVRETDDAAAVERVADLLEDWRTQVLHGHMYRAEVVGTRAALLLEERGLPRPYVINTVHSSRVRSQEGSRFAARADAVDVIAWWRSASRSSRSWRRTAAPGRRSS